MAVCMAALFLILGIFRTVVSHRGNVYVYCDGIVEDEHHCDVHQAMPSTQVIPGCASCAQLGNARNLPLDKNLPGPLGPAAGQGRYRYSRQGSRVLYCCTGFATDAELELRGPEPVHGFSAVMGTDGAQPQAWQTHCDRGDRLSLPG